MVTAATPGSQPGSGASAQGANALPAAKEAPSKIYLDSYLETVTSIPAEVQRILHTIKDIDIRSKELEFKSQAKTERCLAIPPQSSRNTTEEQKKELAVLRGELDVLHANLSMLANEKIELTKTAYELLGGHIELLDEELGKFESEITLNTAQQELQQLNQQQADALAHREKTTTTHVVAHHSNNDSHVGQGDQVAARISTLGAPDEWILARVMNISNDMSTFTILDEDAEEGGTSSIHHLPSKQIIRLPRAKDRKQPKVFSEGSYALAVFPQTTMFYRAFVVQQAKYSSKNSSWGAYILAFDDDEDVNNPGYSINRNVEFQYVVPLPRGFKLA
jgi:hypothetical protein